MSAEKVIYQETSLWVLHTANRGKQKSHSAYTMTKEIAPTFLPFVLGDLTVSCLQLILETSWQKRFICSQYQTKTFHDAYVIAIAI